MDSAFVIGPALHDRMSADDRAFVLWQASADRATDRASYCIGALPIFYGWAKRSQAALERFLGGMIADQELMIPAGSISHGCI